MYFRGIELHISKIIMLSIFLSTSSPRIKTAIVTITIPLVVEINNDFVADIVFVVGNI